MSRYKYEMGGIIRDTEIDFPYNTDDIVELLDEKDQRIAELEEQLKNVDYKELSGLNSSEIYNHQKGYLQGWVCPKCGAVMSPYQNTCPNCTPPQKLSIWC